MRSIPVCAPLLHIAAATAGAPARLSIIETEIPAREARKDNKEGASSQARSLARKFCKFV